MDIQIYSWPSPTYLIFLIFINCRERSEKTYLLYTENRVFAIERPIDGKARHDRRLRQNIYFVFLCWVLMTQAFFKKKLWLWFSQCQERIPKREVKGKETICFFPGTVFMYVRYITFHLDHHHHINQLFYIYTQKIHKTLNKMKD